MLHTQYLVKVLYTVNFGLRHQKKILWRYEVSLLFVHLGDISSTDVERAAFIFISTSQNLALNKFPPVSYRRIVGWRIYFLQIHLFFHTVNEQTNFCAGQMRRSVQHKRDHGTNLNYRLCLTFPVMKP